MSDYRILQASPGDDDTVRALLTQAFGGAVEAKLVDDLRKDGDLPIALVAEARDEIIGYVACSPLLLEGSEARGLAVAPLAVALQWQGHGLGKALMREMQSHATALGYDFLIVLGDPAYYARFGYEVKAAERFETPYNGPYLQVLDLTDQGKTASGVITYAPAFAKLDGAPNASL